MRRRLTAVLAASVAALALAPASSAERPLLGITGDAERFQRLTGQRSDVRQFFIGWKRFGPRIRGTSERQMVVVVLQTGAVTPRGIARGRADRVLMGLNRDVKALGGPIYLRPLAEMNNWRNPYCAYNRDGSRRGAAYSTRNFRKAFRRIYLILHGGRKATINARLAAMGLPGIPRDLPVNRYPRLRVIWNPQGFGSPDLPGNSAQAYYPGDRYVDVVGNDLYYIRGKAMWAAAAALYRAHPTKPYAFPEWGLWGLDAPEFIRAMGRFVRAHRRVEMIAYYNSDRRSIWDLGTKPASRRAYRRWISSLN